MNVPIYDEFHLQFQRLIEEVKQSVCRELDLKASELFALFITKLHQTHPPLQFQTIRLPPPLPGQQHNGNQHHRIINSHASSSNGGAFMFRSSPNPPPPGGLILQHQHSNHSIGAIRPAGSQSINRNASSTVLRQSSSLEHSQSSSITSPSSPTN